MVIVLRLRLVDGRKERIFTGILGIRNPTREMLLRKKSGE